MDTTIAMDWRTFKTHLQAHPDLDLQFQYAENSWVAPSYHITEIKQAPIVSVDCGGKKNTWTEIIVQLWEPEHQQQSRSMKVSKALSIVDVVEKVLPLQPDGLVKIEFGNADFDTRQLLPSALRVEGDHLVVDLRADVTQCKALDRGGSCGTPGTSEEACCSPAKEPAPEFKNLAVTAECCTPGSGCC